MEPASAGASWHSAHTGAAPVAFPKLSLSVIVVGGGGHARVVIEAARSAGYLVLGFVDPASCEDTAHALHVPRLGGDAAIAQYPEARLLLGVGTIGTDDRRRRLVQRLGADRWTSVVHATAWISPSATIRSGVVVLAGAVVNACARVGAFAVINSGAVVEHDAVVGEFAQLAPRSVLGGGACVGDETFIGMGAAVRNHVTVGAGCLVAMGAIVVSDVGDGLSVRGLPAVADGSVSHRR